MTDQYMIRPLVHHDFPDAWKIARENWDGEDYLPRSFHEWVDNTGLFIGVEDMTKREIIALAHVNLLPDGSAWLEGLRVRKDHRGKGLSRILMAEQMTYATKLMERDIVNRIASCTFIDNKTSMHLSQTTGFQLEERYLIVSWNPFGEMEDGIDVQPWKPTWNEIQEIPFFQESHQVVPQFFLMEQFNESWWQVRKSTYRFYKINGARGWINETVEPHCIVLDDSCKAVMNWLQFASFKLGKDASTVVLPKPLLIDELKKTKLAVWSRWEPDCYYFVYRPNINKARV